MGISGSLRAGRSRIEPPDEPETGDTTPVRKRRLDKPDREPEKESPSEEPETDEAPAEEESGPASDSEPESPSPPEPIPEHILKTARAVMGEFAETRPDEYVARLEASGSEWMTITDDSLSNALERELLTSAAAMCLWQETDDLVSGRKCQHSSLMPLARSARYLSAGKRASGALCRS